MAVEPAAIVVRRGVDPDRLDRRTLELEHLGESERACRSGEQSPRECDRDCALHRADRTWRNARARVVALRMRRRLILPAAALTALLSLPVSAPAAILDVRVDSSAAPGLCVSTSAGVGAVSVTVARPGGGALVSVASAAPQAVQCDGTAGRSFLPALPFGGLDGAAGATPPLPGSARGTPPPPPPPAPLPAP